MRIFVTILFLLGSTAFGATPTSSVPPRVNSNNVAGYYDVTWWGAKGDGVTDSTTAIQETITAAAAAGRAVYVPPTPNFYAISSQLTGADNLTILGDGPASVIHQTSSGNSGKNAMRIVGKTNVTIRGVHFQASGAFTTSVATSDASYCGLVLKDCSDVTIEDCIFTGSAYFSLFNWNSDRTIIRNNFFYNPAHVDPYAFQSQTTAIFCADSSDCTITGNKIWRANTIGWVSGIGVYGGLAGPSAIAYRNTVDNNDIFDCSQYGVLCYAGNVNSLFGSKIHNNRFRNIDGSYHHISAGTNYSNITFGTASGTCIYMQQSLESSVSENIMWDSGMFTRSAGTLARSAISGAGTPDITIQNNQIWRHGYIGINVNDSGLAGDYTNKNVTITGNVIVNSGFFVNTGSIQSGSNQFTLDNPFTPVETDTTRPAAGGFWLGDKIQIRGAGAASGILESEIINIVGSVLVLTNTAITSVTNAGVCLSEVSTTPPGGRYGMDLILVHRPLISDNTIIKDLTNIWILTRGIFLQGTSTIDPMLNPTIINNHVFGTYNGIVLQRADGGLIVNNEIANVLTVGISASSLMSDVDIVRNRIQQASTGISVVTTGGRLRDNRIRSTLIGIDSSGADLDDNNIVNVTTAYQTDVPSLKSAVALTGRSARGGLAVDGNAAARITGTSGVNIGTSDFTFILWLAAVDWTPAAESTLFATHSTGNNRVQLCIEPDGTFRTKVTDNGGTTLNYDVLPAIYPSTGVLSNNYIYNVTLTYGRSTNVTLYVNGDSRGTASISAANGINIGSGNGNVWNAGSGYLGSLCGLSVLNRALSPEEVKLAWANGGISYADQYAASSPIYTSNFSAGVDGFSGVGATSVGNIDSIGGQNDNLRTTVDGTGPTSHYTVKSGTVFTPGKAYNVAMSVYIPSSNATLKTVLLSDGIDVAATSSTNADTWLTLSATIVMKDSGFRIFGGTATGGSAFDGNLTDLFYVRGITATEYGAMLDLNLEESDPAVTSTIRDRALDNNGTGTTGLAQMKTRKLLIAKQATLGGTTETTSTIPLAVAQTWNNAATTFDMIDVNATDSASAAASRLVNLRVGGVAKFNISKGGSVTAVGSVTAGGNIFGTLTRGSLTFGGDGAVSVTTSAAAAGTFNSLYDTFGAGSPEGAVTRPVGAVYHRTDGGAVTSLYVKESGAGNTGWVAK